MRNYYDISNEKFEGIQDSLERGYLDELEETVKELNFTDNAEDFAKVIKNLEITVDALKAEKKRLSERQSLIETSIDVLKASLKEKMESVGLAKYKTGIFSYSIRNNGGVLPIELDVPEEVIPDEFMIITRKPNKKAMAEHIEKTGDVGMFHFGERGNHLEIR